MSYKIRHWRASDDIAMVCTRPPTFRCTYPICTSIWTCRAATATASAVAAVIIISSCNGINDNDRRTDADADGLRTTQRRQEATTGNATGGYGEQEGGEGNGEACHADYEIFP